MCTCVHNLNPLLGRCLTCRDITPAKVALFCGIYSLSAKRVRQGCSQLVASHPGVERVAGRPGTPPPLPSSSDGARRDFPPFGCTPSPAGRQERLGGRTDRDRSAAGPRRAARLVCRRTRGQPVVSAGSQGWRPSHFSVSSDAIRRPFAGGDATGGRRAAGTTRRSRCTRARRCHSADSSARSDRDR